MKFMNKLSQLERIVLVFQFNRIFKLLTSLLFICFSNAEKKVKIISLIYMLGKVAFTKNILRTNLITEKNI